MSYDKNATPQYHCIVNNVHSLAASIPSVKRQASKIANGYMKVHDTLEIHDYESGKLLAKFHRINRKCPNNTITYGKWN